MGKDVYYFSHDSDALNDPKILQLLSVYNFQGYGWYWAILEMMRSSDGYRLELSGQFAYQGLAMKLLTTPEKIKIFINDCVEHFHLFSFSDDYILYSVSFLRRMKRWDEIREIKKIAGQKGSEKRWGNNLIMAKNSKPMAYAKKKIAYAKENDGKPIAKKNSAIAKNSKPNGEIN